MAQQTINVGTAPNDGTGTPLRTAFQYTNSNFSELYTAVGPSGNNIVVPGNATITGDLTVDTNVLKVDSAGNRVSVNTTTFATDSAFAVKTTAGKFDVRAAGSLSVKLNSDQSMLYNVPTGSSHLFQINDSDAMTLNSTGLGVGGSPTGKLSLVGTGTYMLTINNTATDARIQLNSAGTEYGQISVGTDVINLVATGANTNMRFLTNGSEKMRLDPSGNVGIGVTPSAWVAGYKSIDIGGGLGLSGLSSQAFIGCNAYDSSGWKKKAAGYANLLLNTSGEYRFHVSTTGAGSAGDAISFVQAMTLDASGNLLVGSTSLTNQEKVVIQYNGNLQQGYVVNDSAGVNSAIAFFLNNGTTIGSITKTTTAVAFNTTSDYRLKEAVQPLVGGLARISALKPSIYKWKADGSNGEGFIAHELAEVIPSAVTGEKDAVNEDGSIKAQGVDLSKVVPVLVAAIQELTAEVNALKNA